jgi:hypothetical protein
MAAKVFFDPWSAQVQVQQQTGQRLMTWFDSIAGLGYEYTIGNTGPLEPQLQDCDLYVSLTRQHASAGGPTGPISATANFGYTPNDLGYLQTWVSSGQGNILMFTNHSQPWGSGPNWPLNEIQLAASLGIPLVFALFAPTGSSPTANPAPCTPIMQMLNMAPNPNGPSSLIAGVSAVQAWDSGGILPGITGMMPGGMIASSGTPIIQLPPSDQCVDTSGLNYNPDACAFAVLYEVGNGKVIVAGHSGITANVNDICKPSPGQIGYADNLTFLNNCIEYLAGPTA